MTGLRGGHRIHRAYVDTSPVFVEKYLLRWCSPPADTAFLRNSFVIFRVFRGFRAEPAAGKNRHADTAIIELTLYASPNLLYEEILHLRAHFCGNLHSSLNPFFPGSGTIRQ